MAFVSARSRSAAEAFARLTPLVEAFYDERTFGFQYVAACPKTKRCAIIDPVLDFDEKSGATATIQADAILDFVVRRNLTVEWILDKKCRSLWRALFPVSGHCDAGHRNNRISPSSSRLQNPALRPCAFLRLSK